MAEAEFAGQVAVVTGGARGLGLATATLLAERGASVCLLDIDAARLAAAPAAIGTGTVRGFETDVTDEAAVLAARDGVLAAFGKVDVLINNAGAYPTTTLRALSMAQWDRVLDVNLKSMFLVTRAFMDPMIRARYGRIVSIASIAGFRPFSIMIDYSAAKAGLLSLIKTFALELAPHQVLCNGVAPGSLATETAKHEPWHVEGLAQVPLGRAAEPEEIAELVLFLASRRNSYVTGETILAAGGMHIA